MPGPKGKKPPSITQEEEKKKLRIKIARQKAIKKRQRTA